MSRGKPRHAAPQTTEEAAEHIRLRQLTREMHEAAQEAREAARELSAARAKCLATADELIGERVRQWDQRISENIKVIRERFDEIGQRIMDREAELLGCPNQEMMLDRILAGLHEALEPVLTRQVTRDVEANVGAYIKNSLRSLGRDPAETDIIITTRGAPVTGNPGLVIDMT